jgi:beta-N-acetylhexosaminidase
LFTRNAKTPDQLRALCDDIHAIRNPALLIGIDEEGGRVQRLRGKGFPNLPPMGSLRHFIEGSTLANSKHARDVGSEIAKKVRRYHIDFSFAPVLDLDYGRSTIIGDRSFGSDSKTVSALAGAFCDGVESVGAATVGKHFPGHGFVAGDTHIEMPQDERKLGEMKEDLAPYKSLRRKLSAVMMAHVVYPNMDAHPAGFSSYWIETVLRGKLNFKGLVCSDDLGMKGASVAGDGCARAKAAFGAGCDVLLFCNEFDVMDEVLEKWKPKFTKARASELAERWKGMEPGWWQSPEQPKE